MSPMTYFDVGSDTISPPVFNVGSMEPDLTTNALKLFLIGSNDMTSNTPIINKKMRTVLRITFETFFIETFVAPT